MKKLQPIFIYLTAILLCSCSGLIDAVLGTNDDMAASTRPKADLFVDPSNLELPAGSGMLLNVTTNSQGSLTFTSSDPSILTIDNDGFIHSIKKGKVSITVSVNSTESYAANSAIFDINVTDYDPYNIPVTLESVSGEEIKLTFQNYNYHDMSIKYSLDYGKSWSDLIIPKGGEGDFGITSISGSIIQLKGDNPSYHYENEGYVRVRCSNKTYLYGNIMSLINSDPQVFKTLNTLREPYTFAQMFSGDSYYDNMQTRYYISNPITNHPEKKFVLPAMILTEHCYDRMFYICQDLTEAPYLPAIEVKPYCYYEMFEGCNQLRKVQKELPAIKMEYACYREMFDGCTELETAPNLPATTLAPYCYRYMFNSCKKLRNVQKVLPAMILADHCYSWMFAGCDELEKAPELPASDLVYGCYQHMFSYSKKLRYVKCMVNNSINSSQYGTAYATGYWLEGAGELVTGEKIFVKKKGVEWKREQSGIPPGWTIVEAEE